MKGIRIKECIKYILAFAVGICVLLGMLVLVTQIPKSSIKDNVRESAEYLCEEKLFPLMVDNVKGSEIDHYADSILLAIAYQYDEKNALDSVMWSSYYHDDYKNENENLFQAVEEDCEANYQYLRYWHGSNVIVRPLLMFFNIKQIYVLNSILLAVLVLALVTLLARKQAITAVIGVIAGLVATAVWFVPLSLEYTWTFLIMLTFSIIAVRMAYKKRYSNLTMMFLISGMITNYLDFLTTETLTFTVPFLLTLWIAEKENVSEPFDKPVIYIVKNAFAWGFGYIGTWVMKWALASLVLHENVMPYVSEHIGERIGGDLGLNPLQYVFGAISKNVRCLFPFEYGAGGAFAGIALLLYVIYLGYVYRAKTVNNKIMIMYACIGVIPYIRYAVLHNHSLLHCFFTYRAQLATILAVVFIVEAVTDKKLLKRRKC